MTSAGDIYVTGTNIDYGVYTGVNTFIASSNLTTPAKLRAIDNYISSTNIGATASLGGSGGLDNYWEGRIVSLYCSGGIYGAMYAVVYHSDVADSSHASYQQHIVSHCTTLWSWGGNQAGILGRSTNYTAPTSYVDNAFGPGTTDGNNLIDAPWNRETQYRWGVPLPVKFWDRGSPDLGGGTGFSQSGPGAPMDASQAYDASSGVVNWYSESHENQYGTPNSVSYGTTDEFQMPQPTFGDARNQGQAKNRYFWGVRPFGNFCAVYGNGMGTATNITVVLMNSAGNLFWAGNTGQTGTYLLAGAMDPYSDGGWDTGIGTDSQVVDNSTSNGSYHQVYNYATSALDNINPYFQMFTMQPEPITDFRWMSMHDVERYSTYGNNIINGGPKFTALGLSGTVYNTSENDATAYTTCDADEPNYFTPVSKTQPIMNVGFNDRTNRTRKSYN